MTTEDHRVRRLGVEDLGEPLEDPEGEAGDDGPEDRPHPADDHHREHHDDQVMPMRGLTR